MANLWTAIDSYLETELLAALGSAGDYSDLQVDFVIVDDIWNLDAITRNGQFPLVLVRSHKASTTTEQHGLFGSAGAISTGTTYDYSLIGVVMVQATENESAKRLAKSSSQELHDRLLYFLASHSRLGGLSVTNAVTGRREIVQGITFQTSGLEVWGRADEDSGDYIGVAVVFFQVTTEAV
jgi:hypothetical protein